ncbi:maleylacetoacetate isomerase [Asticcacaulis sp.]|uniref:maleylacetoacetate isomerase n=1 Tax=Asticcacaulis sp. TaxID=1872648 RepID=UPI002B9C9CCD|nr:maleylacetoacetate isomerase [Asticcacaulis sp.]HTM81589.1 maleylacetoacetate isomerase [Asticcacaulis sp.]
MTDTLDPVLYGYWRSTASYRVRIALNIKAVSYRQRPLDLRTAMHHTKAFLRLNPQGLVPSLESDGMILTQSTAIIEWLDEIYPAPALLPASAAGRAVVRAMAAVITCDTHPLNNLRILNALRDDFYATPEQISAWIARWIGAGFAALETMIEQHGRTFIYGDTVTLADCCLVPQVYSAERFGLDLTAFPRLCAAAAHARALPAFTAAHPDLQPDAD